MQRPPPGWSFNPKLIGHFAHPDLIDSIAKHPAVNVATGVNTFPHVMIHVFFDGESNVFTPVCEKFESNRSDVGYVFEIPNRVDLLRKP